MGRRKAAEAPAPQPGSLAMTPIDRSGPLPSWSPLEPSGGWTPANAWEAALEYADEHDGANMPPARTTTRVAFRALLAAVPGLHRQDVVLRLSGVDVRQEPADDLDAWD